MSKDKDFGRVVLHEKVYTHTPTHTHNCKIITVYSKFEKKKLVIKNEQNALYVST